MLLGLKTCAGFLNCLRGTSEASALLFVFLPFIWGCLHYSPQQNVSISMSSILSTILSLWWLWTRTACTRRALATVYRHITHTHIHSVTHTLRVCLNGAFELSAHAQRSHIDVKLPQSFNINWLWAVVARLGLAWLGASKSIWMPRIIMSYQCESDSLACTHSLSTALSLSLSFDK